MKDAGCLLPACALAAIVVGAAWSAVTGALWHWPPIAAAIGVAYMAASAAAADKKGGG